MARLFGAVRLSVVTALLAAGLSVTATAAADPSKLMGMMPEGFSSSNCNAKTPKAPVLENVLCDKSSVAGGPTGANFALFGNNADTADGFKKVGTTSTIASSCPGGQDSPGSWSYNSSGKTGGQVECGTASTNSGKYAMVAWSDNSRLRVAIIYGNDISSLYQWWKQKSG